MNTAKLKFLSIISILFIVAGCSNTTTITTENAQDSFYSIENEYNQILEGRISNSDIMHLKSRYSKFDIEIVEIFKSESLKNPLTLGDRVQLKKLRERVAHRLEILSDLTD